MDACVPVPQMMGYWVVNWNLDSEDFRLAATPDQFLALLGSQINALKGGSIIHLQVLFQMSAPVA